MSQQKLFGDDHQTLDALRREIKSAHDEFLKERETSDEAQRLEAYQKAWDTVFRILTSLGGEWQTVAASHDQSDFPIIVAIAQIAGEAERFAGVLHMYSGRERGRLLDELVGMGITHKTAVVMRNMPKEQLDALFAERIAELEKRPDPIQEETHGNTE
jgi:hypothetical protein